MFAAQAVVPRGVVGDEVEDDWNLDGLTEDARLAFRLAAAIANADVTPSWYPGDEFEAVRRAALDAVRD